MADFYNLISSVFGLVWIYKVQILGSAFLSLTAFEYLYRAYLLDKRKRQLEEIKKILKGLTLIKRDTMAIKDKTRDELEHSHLEHRIDNLALEMRQGLRINVIQTNAEFEVLNSRFDILDKVVIEVELLKKDTAFIRDGKRWKWVVGLALIGLITTVNFTTIKALVAKWLPW